jgi:predicted nucleic-acid-binding Zn-ribbon protein
MSLKKKEKELLNSLASISRKCNNCGSLRINYSPDKFIQNINNRDRGIECWIKICQKCGYMEFFNVNILKKIRKDMKKHPIKYYRMRGDAILKSLFSPLKKFVDKILFIKDFIK